MLARQTILECHNAALELKLDREALLRGIHPHFIVTIPKAPTQSSQLLADLEELCQAGYLSDGSLPIRTWLETAIVLSQPRVQAQVFRRAFHALDLGIPPPLPPALAFEQSSAGTSTSPGSSARPALGPFVEELERLLRDRERCVNDDTRKAQIVDRIDELVTFIIANARARPGDILAGTEIIKPIGSGNFGTIWLSKKPGTGAFAATKVFHLEKLAEGRMLWHFRRSTIAMTRLRDDKQRSDHIVKIHELDESTLSFSMDFLSEGNLEDIASRGWTLMKKLRIMTTVCGAVRAAHRIGVIHRDIKPANVVLDRVHEPILTDFDIADIKFLTRLSATPGGLGTPVFAAPEQLEHADQADERSDIYSLGRLLYFLLLERPPSLKIEKIPNLENLSRYPPALVSIVRRATAYAPESRFQTVRELEDAIHGYQTRSAAAMALLGQMGRWIRANAALFSVLLTVVVAAVVVVILQADRAREARERAVTAEALQLKLTNALDALNNANAEYRDLSEQKKTVRAEISRLEAELDALRAQQRRSSSTSERSRLDLEIRQKMAQLDEQQAKQRGIDEHIQQVRSRLDAASKSAGLSSFVAPSKPASPKELNTGALPEAPQSDPTIAPVVASSGQAQQAVSSASTIRVDAPSVATTPLYVPPQPSCRARNWICDAEHPCCDSIPCNKGICGAPTCTVAGDWCGNESQCCSKRCENSKCTL